MDQPPRLGALVRRPQQDRSVRRAHRQQLSVGAEGELPRRLVADLHPPRELKRDGAARYDRPPIAARRQRERKRQGGGAPHARLLLTCSNTSFERPGVARIRSSSAFISACAPRLEPSPTAERRDHPRGSLRIELVDGEDHVGEEAVALAAVDASARWLAPNAPTSERSRFGLTRVKSGWASSLCTAPACRRGSTAPGP